MPLCSICIIGPNSFFFHPEVERKINHAETLISFPNITRAYK